MILSPSSTAKKYTKPHTRLPLLSLLETEEAVSLKRISEVLSVSRMTAQRMAEELIGEGLVRSFHGKDPLEHRLCTLYTLSPAPSLAVLDIRASEPLMTAYLYRDGLLDALSANYSFGQHLKGNLDHLTETVRLYQGLHMPICLLSPLYKPSEECDNTDVPIVREEMAISQILFHHPAFRAVSSLIYLSLGEESFGAWFVRAHTKAAWFIPSGALFAFDIPPYIKALSSREISAILSEHLPSVRPAACLIEDKKGLLTPQDSSRSTSVPLPSFGAHILPLPRDTRKSDRAFNSQDELPCFICDRRTPLAVVGAIALHREDRWLGL